MSWYTNGSSWSRCVNVKLDVSPQVDAHPDPSPCTAPHELQHYRGAVLYWFNRQRLHRQHHPLHPQDGDGRVQQPRLWPRRMTTLSSQQRRPWNSLFHSYFDRYTPHLWRFVVSSCIQKPCSRPLFLRMFNLEYLVLKICMNENI